MNITNEGIRLIQHFEGCRLTAYQDAVGIWTIGYGRTEDVQPGQTITQHQADVMLGEDLARFSMAVRDLVPPTLADHQFSALVSFAYNVGVGALKSSTLLKRLLAGSYWDAANEFARWNKAGGKTLPGLVKRRWAERDLFCGFPVRLA